MAQQYNFVNYDDDDNDHNHDIAICIEYQNNYENEIQLIGKSQTYIEAYYDMFGIVESCLENVIETMQPISYSTILQELQEYVSNSSNNLGMIEYQLGKENAYNYFEGIFNPPDTLINGSNYNQIDGNFQERSKYVMLVLEHVRIHILNEFEGFSN
jgi:hypothetical protein